MTNDALRLGWTALLVGIAYYAGCLAGFAMRLPSSGISLFWPSNALLTAILLVAPIASWPVLLVGAFVAHAIAHWQDGISPAFWSIQFLGNASQAVLAAWLIRRYSGPSSSDLGTRRHVVGFLLACLCAPAAASLIPASVYVSLGWATDFWQAWRTRTVSNTVAMLTLVPSLLAGWQLFTTRPVVASSRLAEFSLLLVGVGAVHTFVAFAGWTHSVGVLIAVYAPLPFLLWAAVRFSVGGVSIALLTTALLTVWTARSGLSPLDSGGPANLITGVQLILAATAVPMMLLASVLQESRAEHASLLQVEQQNRAILRALPDLTFLQTRGRDKSAPPGAADASAPHWSVRSVAGAPATDVLSGDHPRVTSAMLAAAAFDEPAIVEYTETVDGTSRRFEARFVAVDTERVLTIVRDVTERWRAECELREARERYALATAAGGIGVWEYDVENGAVRVEGSLKQSLGYAEHEIGNRLTDWQTHIFSADREDVLTRLANLASGAAAIFESEFRFVHRDGSTRWIRSKGALTDTGDGKPRRVRGTYTDVTEYKESSEALRIANDRLVRMGRVAAMAEVSASIAHELRQPLTAISTNAGAGLCLAERNASNAEMRELFAELVEDSGRAGQIIQRTQRMFTHDALCALPVNLNAVARDIVEIAAARLRQAEVRLHLRLARDLPPVRADAVQMQQVLLNLVVNAIEAMHQISDRPRRLTIETRCGRKNAIVSVRDAGQGLALDEPGRVFDAFFTTKSGGTGMGLSIGRTILANHNGALWAVNNADVGATFRFRVPLIAAFPRPGGRKPKLSSHTRSARVRAVGGSTSSS